MKSIAKQLAMPMLAFSLLMACLHPHAQTGMRTEVQKPLLAAQEALKNNHFDQALRLAG